MMLRMLMVVVMMVDCARVCLAGPAPGAATTAADLADAVETQANLASSEDVVDAVDAAAEALA